MGHPLSQQNLANEIGKRFGVRCIYRYDNVKQKFLYKFFRGKTYLGSTADPDKVVKLMERYVSCDRN